MRLFGTKVTCVCSMHLLMVKDASHRVGWEGGMRGLQVTLFSMYALNLCSQIRFEAAMLIPHCLLVFLNEFLLLFLLLHPVLTWNDKVRCDPTFWAGPGKRTDCTAKFYMTGAPFPVQTYNHLYKQSIVSLSSLLHFLNNLKLSSPTPQKNPQPKAFIEVFKEHEGEKHFTHRLIFL